MRFLVFDIYNILASMEGEYCSDLMSKGEDNLCSITISGYNLKSIKNTNQLNILDILSLVFTIVSIIFFYLFRNIQN